MTAHAGEKAPLRRWHTECERRLRRTLAAAAVLVLAVVGCGDDAVEEQNVMGVNAEVGDILLRSVHVEAPGLPRYLPGQNARVWLTLLNSGRWPDALAEVSSPVARDVAIRWDRTCDGRFETVSSLPLAPQEPVPPEVAGGVPPADAYHLVMVDLTVAVVSGSNVPLTLRFRDAGEVTIEPFVQPYNEPRAEPSSRCNR